MFTQFVLSTALYSLYTWQLLNLYGEWNYDIVALWMAKAVAWILDLFICGWWPWCHIQMPLLSPWNILDNHPHLDIVFSQISCIVHFFWKIVCYSCMHPIWVPNKKTIYLLLQNRSLRILDSQHGIYCNGFCSVRDIPGFEKKLVFGVI